MPLTDAAGKARALYEARQSRQQIEPFCDENLRSRPRERQTEKRPGGAEIPVG